MLYIRPYFLASFHNLFKGNGTLSGEATLSNLYLLPFLTGINSYRKGKPSMCICTIYTLKFKENLKA